jgi:hypothetical protein
MTLVVALSGAAIAAPRRPDDPIAVACGPPPALEPVELPDMAALAQEYSFSAFESQDDLYYEPTAEPPPPAISRHVDLASSQRASAGTRTKTAGRVRIRGPPAKSRAAHSLMAGCSFLLAERL